MTGLHCLGVDSADVVGFDWMNVAKGAAGMLQGAGGLMSEKKGGGADLEKKMLEEEKRRAEQSATTMKIVLGVAGGLAGVGLIAFLATRR